MKVSTIVRNLTPATKKNPYSIRDWAASDQPNTEANADFAEDVATGLLDLLELVDFDIEPWMDRSIHGRQSPRRFIEDLRSKYRTVQGRRALVGLIDVAVEVLTAAKWVDDLPPRVLPVKPRPAEPVTRQNIIAIRSESDIPAAVAELTEKSTEHAVIVSRDQVVAQRDEQISGVSDTSETRCSVLQNHRLVSGIAADSVSDRIPTEKICGNCGVSKPSTEFYRYARSADRLQFDCKECNKARVRRRREGGAV